MYPTYQVYHNMQRNESHRQGEKHDPTDYIPRPPGRSRYLRLRGTILNRIYGAHKNLYISLFLLTVFGPIYYGPP